MFEYDICYCGNNENCPLKDDCVRAQSRPAGIYTISLFYQADKNYCEYFYPIKKEDN